MSVCVPNTPSHQAWPSKFPAESVERVGGLHHCGGLRKQATKDQIDPSAN